MKNNSVGRSKTGQHHANTNVRDASRQRKGSLWILKSGSLMSGSLVRSNK
ncbi:hypothetical protein [Streptomyces sp. NPDC046332]